jgi:hypothetical protein
MQNPKRYSSLHLSHTECLIPFSYVEPRKIWCQNPCELVKCGSNTKQHSVNPSLVMGDIPRDFHRGDGYRCWFRVYPVRRDHRRGSGRSGAAHATTRGGLVVRDRKYDFGGANARPLGAARARRLGSKLSPLLAPATDGKTVARAFWITGRGDFRATDWNVHHASGGPIARISKAIPCGGRHRWIGGFHNALCECIGVVGPVLIG